MSHEVRTPLNGIVGLTELMLDDRDEPLSPALREQLLVVQRSGRTLRVIVDDILDFAKLDARRMTLHAAGFELGPALDDIGRLYQGMARTRGLTLSVEAHGLPERVIGDELRLRQVLSNLVVNAIKFTERGGVRLLASARRLAAERAELAIEVIDSGVGIPAGELQGLFEPFRQVNSALQRPSGGGTGLGLALCRQLLELMGGTVSVRSTLGQGSTFRVELPIDVVRWQPEAPAPSPIHDAPSLAGSGRPAERGGHAKAPAPPVAAPGGGERPPSTAGTVLVAEDDRVNQLVVAGMLRRLGYGVRLVSDGQEALAALAEGGFVAVLMDCQMPVLDGLEATRQARAGGATLPIVALTAFAGPEDRARCLEAGMDEHLTKPLDRERLGAVLARLVAAPALAASG